jgi:hypothetical protein
MAHGSIVDLPEFFSYHRIKGEDVHFRTSVGSWTATNATLSVEFNDTRYFDYNSLRIVPSSLGEVTITVNPIPMLESDILDSFIFQTWLKSVNDFVAEIQVSVGSFSQSNRSVPVTNSNWNLVRGFSAETPDEFSAQNVSVVLKFRDHGAAPILMTVPNLILEYGITESTFLREVVPYMPEVFSEFDKQATDPTFPMYRFMEIGTGYANLAFNQQLHYQYRDNESGFDLDDNDTRSGLTDPLFADDVHLPWLSQFAGLAQRETNVSSLLSGYAITDPDEIENFIRWQVATAFFGRKAGSFEALRETVKYALTGTKFTTVYKHYLGNPWHIKIYTKTDETPGGVEGQSSQIILDLMQKAKPVGYEVFHEANVDGSDRSFIIGSPTLGILGTSRL